MNESYPQTASSFFISFFYFHAKKLHLDNGLGMLTGTNRGTTGTNRG